MTPTHWAAPTAQHPVDAVVRLPGSKSVTNRALVLAALAGGVSRLRRPLRSRDTLLMAAGLRVLGLDVRDDHDDWVVTGTRDPLAPTGDAVDVGNAGTVARFLPPVAALAVGHVRFDGDPRVRERPIGPLVAAMRALGARVDDDGRGALPFTVCGVGRVPGGDVELDASSSSQLVSGLLLAAPRYDGGATVRHIGPPMPSAPHLHMTVVMLRSAGAVVDDIDPDVWRVEPGALTPADTVIEPDLSSAAPFAAAAVVTGGRVRIADWPAGSTQPGALLPGPLTAMGASCTRDEQGLTVVGTGRVQGLDADLRDCGELTPVLTALAAVADSPSRLRGVAHLRLQETDRLAALATEIGRLGGDVRESADGLQVRPVPLHGGVFRTYDDHRLAMAAAVLGLVVPGVEVENVETTAKTLPGFVDLWQQVLTPAEVGR